MSTFFGLSVVDFDQSLNYSSNQSSLSVNLVKCDDQVFSPPVIGAPVTFTYGTTYAGILDRYVRDNTPDEKYSVYLTNGVELLTGTQLILKGYTGYTNLIPNLFNIYAYIYKLNLDSPGSPTNPLLSHEGLLWDDVLQALINLFDNDNPEYGRFITYKGFKYRVDFSELPTLATDYRILSESMSIMDLISEICDIGGHDFYVELVPAVGTAYEGVVDGIFTVRTVDRTIPVNEDALSDYIDSLTCLTSKSIGRERRKSTHNKFLIGAPVERMYFNYPQNWENNTIEGGITQEEYADDTVLPYFGLDINNDAIIGYTPEGDNDYYFTIDVRDVDHPSIGDTYLTSMKEVRAAKRSMDAWIVFLNKNNANKYLIDNTITGPTDENAVWEPFQIPMLTSLLDGLPSESAIPAWMKVGVLGGGYTGVGITKYGFDHTYKFGLSQDPKIFAKVVYDVTFDYSGGAPSKAQVDDSRLLHYPRTDTLNPFFGRASILNEVTSPCYTTARMFEWDLKDKASGSTYWTAVYNKFKGELVSSDSFRSMAFESLQGQSYTKDILAGGRIDKVNQLYARLRDIGENYYNKRFMISIPSVVGFKENTGDGKVNLSQEISDAGYIDEALWDDVYNLGLIPNASGINDLTTSDNRIQPFVKFDNAYLVDSGGIILDARYDLSDIGEGDKVKQFSSNKVVDKDITTPDGTVILASGESSDIVDVWVKCRMQGETVFEDNSLLLNPRAVIELPGTVSVPSQYDTKTVKGRKAFFSLLTDFGSKYAFNGIDENVVINEIGAKAVDTVGADDAIFADGENITFADIYAIPLKSNILNYGPWASGVQGVGAEVNAGIGVYDFLGGQVEYVQDDNYAPWNYGGFTRMNLAANAAVNNALSRPTYEDTGSVSLNGPPIFNVGQPFGTNGPNITDVTVRYGSEGINTTYSFQSWSDHRRLASAKSSRLTSFNKESKQLRDISRSYFEGIKNHLWNNTQSFHKDMNNKFTNLEKYSKRDQNNTSSRVLASQAEPFGSTVVVQPSYNAARQTETDYSDMAIVSFDAVFAPFSTVDHDKLPVMTFVEPSGEDLKVTSSVLNPYASGNPIHVLTSNDELGSNTILNRDQSIDPTYPIPNVRGIGMKMPMWGTGWGYDINDKPVPNKSGEGTPEEDLSDEFDPEYLWNIKKWKTGPIDLRWDENRGVWAPGGTSGGGGDFFWFTVDQLICPGDDPYNYPSGGLLVTAVYSSDGKEPVGAETDGSYFIYDYLGILEYSLDAKDGIEGSKGRASRGAEIGTNAYQWILDSINIAATCGGP